MHHLAMKMLWPRGLVLSTDLDGIMSSNNPKDCLMTGEMRKAVFLAEREVKSELTDPYDNSGRENFRETERRS